MPVERLRWISFAHVEADECGAMNEFLAVAPQAQVAHSGLGCMVSVNDLADRPPRPLGDGEVLELGEGPTGPPGAGDRHPARAAQLGVAPALRAADRDAFRRRPVHPDRRRLPPSPTATSSKASIQAEEIFRATSLGPAVPATLAPAGRARAEDAWPPCTARRSAATAARCFAPWPTCTSRSSAAGLAATPTLRASPYSIAPMAMRLAATEYERVPRGACSADAAGVVAADELPRLGRSGDGGPRPRDGRHGRSPWEGRRQLKEATKRGGDFIDALTAPAGRGTRGPGPAAHPRPAARRPGPRRPRAGGADPGLIRRRRLPAAQTDGLEPWTLGFLARRHPHPRPVDAPHGHRRGHRARADADRRPRRRPGGRCRTASGQAVTASRARLTLTGPAGGSLDVR